MNKRISIALALSAAALAVALSLTACGEKSIPKNSVAIAGDDPITQAEFKHWYAIAAKSQQPPPTKGKKKKPVKIPSLKSAQGKQIKDQVMQFLVNAAWIRQQADEDDVKVTKPQVEKEFEKTKKQFFKKEKDYRKFLETSGMSQKDVFTRVELQLTSNKIREKITKEKKEITDDDIEKYFKKNKRQFETPESRDINVIQTKKKGKAEEALNALKSGQSFKQVAKQFSQDQASKKTGKLAGVTKGQFGEDFDKKVFTVKRGKRVGPFKTQFGYYIVETTKITPKKTTPLGKAKPQIRSILKSQNQQEALQKFITDFQKRWKDKTKCLKGYIIQECKNAPKPKTTAPTGPVPPQGGAPPRGGAPPQGGQAPPRGGQAPPPPPPSGGGQK